MIENGQPDGGYLLTHGTLKVPFQVQYENRKRLTIHVHPDLHLEVLAPKGRNIKRVLQRVDARASWIAKHWRYFQQFQPTAPERNYVSGETHLYLGRQYRLKVIKSEDYSVKLKGRHLLVHLSNRDDHVVIKELVDAWYREHAKRLFEKHLEKCLESCKSLHLAGAPKIRVHSMRRRWGSCTKSGNITLNIDLVKTPVNCVEYVIVHELCHLKVHDHSSQFYRLLSQCMPDWEQRKKRLDSFRLE